MTCGSKEWFDGTIARQRAKLSRIVARLFSKAGLDEGGADMLPRHILRSILRVLHPAESATRRLIASAARDIAVKLTIRQGKRRPLPQFRPAEREVSAGTAGTEDLAGTVDPSLDVPASVTATVILKNPSPRPMTNIRYKGKLVPVGQMPWLPKPERVLGPVGSFNLFDPPLCVFPAPKRRANRPCRVSPFLAHGRHLRLHRRSPSPGFKVATPTRRSMPFTSAAVCAR